MATCDHPSDLDLVGQPSLARPGLESDSRPLALPAEEKKQVREFSNPQKKEVGDIFCLIESRPRNPWAVIGSLAFLSALLLALILIPLYLTDPLPKREMVTKLYLQPPPAAGAKVINIQAPKPTSTYTPTSITIPAPTHTTREATPPPADTSNEEVAGIPGGVFGGVPGGVLTETLGGSRNMPLLAKTPDPTPVRRMRVASRVAEANLIHDVPPQYPREAGRERIEGTVVLMAVIGKDGSVLDLKVESGLPLLAQAAIEAVKQWRYKPYLSNGEPVEIDSRITINFTLSKG
jgi:protein TonB